MPSKFRKPRNPANAKPAIRPSTTSIYSKQIRARTHNSGTVLTPAGPFLKSKVHLVPVGARVKHAKDSIQIIGRDGKILHSSPISRPADPRISATTAITKAMRPDDDAGVQEGWDAYVHWLNPITNNEITHFSTSWIVPDAPSNDDQLIFIFNALQSEDGTGSLQSVLQYGESGAGGGKYWAIATWYLLNDEVYHSSPVQVSSGALLVGMMIMTDRIDDDDDKTRYYYWDCTFSGYPQTILYMSTDNELAEAFETLETYYCKSIADLPSGSVNMKSIYLQTGFDCPSMSWGSVNDATDDVTVTVVTDGSYNGEVDINFGPPPILVGGSVGNLRQPTHVKPL